jgi:hypothetical protein
MISRLQNMWIKTKLLLLCCILLVGFIVFGLISVQVVAEIEVNGPLYDRIVQDQNLIAKVCPRYFPLVKLASLTD